MVKRKTTAMYKPLELIGKLSLFDLRSGIKQPIFQAMSQLLKSVYHIALQISPGTFTTDMYMLVTSGKKKTLCLLINFCLGFFNDQQSRYPWLISLTSNGLRQVAYSLVSCIYYCMSEVPVLLDVTWVKVICWQIRICTRDIV